MGGAESTVFRTKKHQKDAKITQKIGIVLFGSKMLQVRVLSLRPNKDYNFDTMGIEAIVLIFCSKALIYKAFFVL